MITAHQSRDAYFRLFVDIHPGKVCPFYSIYLTNWEKLPIIGHFYPGRVFHFAVKYSPLQLGPQKLKNDPKIRIEENIKMKVVQIHD